MDPHKVIPIPEEIAELSGLPAYDIFTKYLTPEMITFITAQTCQYAQRDRNDQTFNVSEGEIAKFLGIILASGYHHLPTEDSYWSTSEDLDAPIFRKIMSRERFRSIKKYLHIADNANLAKSKVAKVLPLFNMLKERCQQFGVFDELLSVDESMVPYRGLHSAKQYMRNKPVKFGYKVWMLCSARGYPYNFELYCGKDDKRKTPLGTHVVNTMLEPISHVDSHVVFFDNFFTSHKLLSELADKNIRACGTLRDGRSGRCPLESIKSIEKKPRGSYDYKTDGTVLCVRWNDNKAVTVATNYYDVNPLHKVERWIKGSGKKSISQPHPIKMYNSGMGGVDTCDHLLSSYRPRFRAKKWWWNLFTHALNLSVVAAYKCYSLANPNQKMSHLQFRRDVTRTLLSRQIDRTRMGGPSCAPASLVRYDGINHFLESCTQGRCVKCQKNTRLSCVKCNKRLHRACSDLYHKQ